MFVDANSIPKNSQVKCDICVIGAGAAGIVLALGFKNSPLNVCVVEGGGLGYDKEVHKLYDFEAIGLPISLHSRARQFGGTTTVWMGLWKQMDRIDFEIRSWVPRSGWPFVLKDMILYYKRAAELLSVDCVSTPSTERQLFRENSTFQVTDFARVEKSNLDFGKKFHHELEVSKNITVLLNANVTAFRANQGCKIVECADVKTLSGNSFQIGARYFILAAGGIENARLLLLSDSINKHGLGNDYDQVGRYYMDHPKGVAGRVKLHRSLAFSRFAFSGLRLSDEVQRKYQVLNSMAMLLPEKQSLLNRAKEKILGVSRHRDTFLLRNFLEQVPNPNNRVYLNDTRDSLGCRKVTVDWLVSELDKKTIFTFHRLLQEELKNLGVGELESQLLEGTYAEWPIAQDASHHIGTTRMGTNPKNSVTDPNCRLHGIENLYIAGSSVFPTSGYANPMAMTIALTLRLSDHLKLKFTG